MYDAEQKSLKFIFYVNHPYENISIALPYVPNRT